MISFLRKKHKKPFLGAFFAFVFLSSFFILKENVQAQLYTNYKTLFSGTQPGPTLKLITPLFKPKAGSTTELEPSIKFNLQASFPYLEGNNNSISWFWDHIRDFKENGGSEYVFLLRICNTGASGEGSCMFSVIPHKSEMADDKSIYCPNNVCSLPPAGSALQKIYHYSAGINGGTLISGSPYTKFHVAFTVSDLALLNYGNPGKLYAPDSVKDIFKVGDKTVYKADAWYCAGGVSGEPLPAADDPNDPNIRQFNKICGEGKAYFKIAESSTFTMPQTADEALQQPAGTIDTVNTNTKADTSDTLPVCGILPTDDGTIAGCAARIIYYVIYWPTAWIAGIIGKAFDFFLGYSISDESYRAAIIVTGWKLVRDISNIFFIIILIYTGLATVFGFDGVSMKKVVPAVIINALLINFSLFGTQVVIDISNITARLFYNTMSVCDGECRYIDTSKGKIIENPSVDTVGGYKPLSQKIVASFNPQRVFNTETLSDSPDKTASSTVSSLNSQAADQNLGSASKKSPYSADYAGYYIVITIIAAFIMFALAKMFFGVMFMFVGRVVGLYITMIFAPFAVLTRGNMPIVSNIRDLAWDSWKKDLLEYSLLAPIFVFFLYIIYAFINSDMTKVFLSTSASGGFMETVLSIAIPMIIIYTLIGYGVNLAKKYAGKAGEMLQSLGTKATGLVGGATVGVATGGLAWAGRNVVGRGLGAIGNIKRTRTGADGKEIKESLASRWAANANNSWLARQWNNAYSKSQTGSWDARNAGLKIGGKDYTANSALSSGLGKLGIGLSDKVSGVLGLGQDKALGKDGKPGGNVMINKKRADALQKELEEKIQMSHLSEEDAKAAWEGYKRKQVKEMVEASEEFKNTSTKTKEAQETLVTAKKKLDEAKSSGTQEAQQLATTVYEDAEKKLQEAKKAEEALYRKAEDDKFKKYGKVKDAKSFATAMRAEYAQKLQEKAIINDLLNSKGLFASIIGGLAAGMGPGLVTLGGMFGNQLTKEIVDNATGARSKALKAMIDKATKASGADSALGKLEKKVEKHQEEILAAVSKALGKSYKDYEELEKSVDLDDGLTTREAELEEEIQDCDEKIRSLAKGSPERKEEMLKKQKAKNLLNKLRNSIKDLEQATKNLNEYKDKQKEKEEREAEKKKDK